MRVEATRPQGWFWVDWWLTNHCSWHCSYCPELLRSGSITPVSLKDCYNFLDQLDSYCQGRSLRPRIKITGGEPIEWLPLPDLLHRAKQKGIHLSLRTNANVDRNLWISIIEHLDDVEMNFHPEHTQTSVFLLNLDRAVSNNLNVRAVFNMLPERFEELEEVIEKIKSKYPSVSLERRMLFNDPGKNTQPKEYSPVQQVKIVRQHGDIQIVTDQGIEYSDYPSLVSENKNSFKDFLCRAGLEQIIVDAWGRVARGHCRQGGHLGSINTTINWPNDPIACRKDLCTNAFDILATKTST